MPRKPSFKCALITGGKSGLGKALSDFLTQKGMRVIATSSDDYDLRVAKKRQALLNLITKEKPDLIINNAGCGLYGPALTHPIVDQLEVVELNVVALTEITLHAAKTLKNAGISGTILNISSATSLVPFPSFAIYASSKRYVNALSEMLDFELQDLGIRVLCALPGQIATDFRNRASKGYPQKKDCRTMTAEKATYHLWKQIIKGKRLYVFDLRTRLMILLASFFPNSLVARFLSRSISNRY